MPPLTDPEVRRLLCLALKNWRVTGEVLWKDIAQEWARKHVTVDVGRLTEMLYEHVRNNRLVQQVRETRPEYPAGFHYDFILGIEDKQVYFETVLDDDDPSDPRLAVVSVHWAD